MGKGIEFFEWMWYKICSKIVSLNKGKKANAVLYLTIGANLFVMLVQLLNASVDPQS